MGKYIDVNTNEIDISKFKYSTEYANKVQKIGDEIDTISMDEYQSLHKDMF